MRKKQVEETTKKKRKKVTEKRGLKEDGDPVMASNVSNVDGGKLAKGLGALKKGKASESSKGKLKRAKKKKAKKKKKIAARNVEERPVLVKVTKNGQSTGVVDILSASTSGHRAAPSSALAFLAGNKLAAVGEGRQSAW